MKVLQVLLLLIGLFVLLLLLGGGCVLQGYNKAIALNEAVDNAWSEVENQLQRRYDLIPNLVETVKGVAKQEKDVFLGIAKAREAYFQAKTPDEKIAAAGDVERALSRLLLLREAYPELRSNEAFLKLQDQIEGTENRLTVARQRYNDQVRQLNTFVRQFPGRFFAALAGVGPREYFEIEAEAAQRPNVDFSGE